MRHIALQFSERCRVKSWQEDTLILRTPYNGSMAKSNNTTCQKNGHSKMVNQPPLRDLHNVDSVATQQSGSPRRFGSPHTHVLCLLPATSEKGHSPSNAMTEKSPGVNINGVRRRVGSL